jgi:hypothetical protein
VQFLKSCTMGILRPPYAGAFFRKERRESAYKSMAFGQAVCSRMPFWSHTQRIHHDNSDMGLQLLGNKALLWGITGKSAPILAEITIRKSQKLKITRTPTIDCTPKSFTASLKTIAHTRARATACDISVATNLTDIMRV